jgi:hypothetical protein
MKCVLPSCQATETDVTGLWGRGICYRHLGLYTAWPASPLDRPPTREEWTAFLAHLSDANTTGAAA